MRVILHEPVVVSVVPVNEETQKWGVYAIPWMWEHPDGAFYIRISGHQDTSSPNYRQTAPDLYFRSDDNGENWMPLCESSGKELAQVFPTFFGVGRPFLKLESGEWIGLQLESQLAPITDIPRLEKTVPIPSGEALLGIWRYGDIPEACKAMELVTYDAAGKKLRAERVQINFPELEVESVCASQHTDGKVTLVADYVPVETIFYNPMCTIQEILELPDGSLGGLLYGQAPNVTDRDYGLVYMMRSEDRGRTWRKIGTVGCYDPEVGYGYTNENSMVRASDGSLLVVMRTEKCVPNEIQRDTSTMFSRSFDGGYTWSKPTAIADSSVTPHLVSLENGVIVFVYGRPGVHIKYSTDCGASWSEPYTIIGKTLDEHRRAGDAYMDCKYWDMDTYANTFMYPISADTVLLCYNDMKHQTGDGLNHKATLVRRISLASENTGYAGGGVP